MNAMQDNALSITQYLCMCMCELQSPINVIAAAPTQSLTLPWSFLVGLSCQPDVVVYFMHCIADSSFLTPPGCLSFRLLWYPENNHSLSKVDAESDGFMNIALWMTQHLSL